MRLVPKNWDECNPVLVMMGAGFVFGGGYALSFMGIKGPLIIWLVRGIFAIPVAIGAIVLVRQFQLRRKQQIRKNSDRPNIRQA
jgi:membrane protein implicated in regulation of membrane protease activity